MKKSLYLLGFLTVISFTTGILFKFEHWPGGSFILLLSTVLLIIGLLPLLFINLYKQEISKIGVLKIKADKKKSIQFWTPSLKFI